MDNYTKELMEKSSWSGEELGVYLLHNLEHRIRGTKDNSSSWEPIPQEKFNNMFLSLTQEGYTTFETFEVLYGAFMRAYNYSECMKQQFLNNYNKYLLSFQEINRVEKFSIICERLPLILSQEQYDTAYNVCKAKVDDTKISFQELFFHTVYDYSMGYKYSWDIEIPEDVRTALAGAEKEKAANKRILLNWGIDLSKGYLTFKDGKRSEEMTLSDLREVLLDKLGSGLSLNDIMSKLMFKGAKYMEDEYNRVTNHKLPRLKRGELISILDSFQELKSLNNHSTGAKIALASIITKLILKNCEWTFSDPPESYSKLDVLLDELGRYYGAYTDRLDNSGNVTKELLIKSQFTDFKRDYPELTEAVISTLKELPSCKKIKPTQYYKELIPWRELAEYNFLNYKDIVKVTDDNIIETYISNNEGSRNYYSGIAIDRGDTKECINSLELEGTLEGMDDLLENPDKAGYIQDGLLSAMPALKNLYAYNAIIDIILDKFKELSFMSIAKYDTSYFEKLINYGNTLLYSTYNVANGKKRNEKREFLKKYYKPVECAELKPSEEKIKAVRKVVKALKGYSKETAKELESFDTFINYLAQIERK